MRNADVSKNSYILVVADSREVNPAISVYSITMAGEFYFTMGVDLCESG